MLVGTEFIDFYLPQHTFIHHSPFITDLGEKFAYYVNF
jgi:hypothetical protein